MATPHVPDLPATERPPGPRITGSSSVTCGCKQVDPRILPSSTPYQSGLPHQLGAAYLRIRLPTSIMPYAPGHCNTPLVLRPDEDYVGLAGGGVDANLRGD